MFERIRPELQCLSPKGLNYNACNAKVRINMLVTIRSELQYLKGYVPTDNVCKKKVSITIFVMIRCELQCLKGIGITIPIRKTSELQCL